MAFDHRVPTEGPAEQFDAIVIGAGAGGLCAAARLAAADLSVLVIESEPRVGGRAATVIEDGFMINTGAVAIEYGGVLEETFTLVNAPFEIRKPEPATLFRIKGRDVDISRGGWGRLLNGITKKGAGVLASMSAARQGDMPDPTLSTRDWLSRYTANKTVHAIFRNLCAAIFAVNSEELPAKAFLTYFIDKGAFRNFGFSPTGTGGLMAGLAEAIVARGGQVWTAARVEHLIVDGDRVTGAAIHQGDRLKVVGAHLFISNIGPAQTVELVGRQHYDHLYLERMERDLRPTANIVFNITSTQELMDAPGIITFGITRRLCNMANLTATCPELAPEGHHLYVAYAVPIPAVGPFDADAEIEAAFADLRDEFPGFDQRARVLSVRVMIGETPAQRSIAGLDLPRETPLANLWNVGDGVREYANGGVQACAEGAKLVVEQILVAA